MAHSIQADEPDDGYASLNDLTAATAAPEADVELPSGGKVRVRGITRHELIKSGEGDAPADEVERRTVAYGMVRPKMSVAQVGAWQKRHGATLDLGAVTKAIRNLSGLGEGAGKSDVAPVRD